MYFDNSGNVVVEMPDVEVRCPSCKHQITVDGETFSDEFLEPLASALTECDRCGNEFYTHIKN